MTKRRWPKRLALGVLGFFGLLVLLLLGGYGYLTSKAGGERLRRLAIEKVNASIQGSLDFQRSEYSGNRLVLHGVTLKDPEGEVVAEIEELEVRVGIGELLHKRIDLRKVRILRPRLHLLQDERGLNLARAVAPRNPSQKEEPAQGEEKGSLAFSLDQLVLEHGDVQFVQEQEGEDRVIRLQDLNAEGSASMTAQELKAALKLGGEVTEPVEGPLQLELSGNGRGEHRTADVSLVLAGAELKVKAVATGTAEVDVEIERLVADPKTVAAFMPSYPLQAPVSLQGRLSLDGAQAAVKLEARAGSSRATVDGSANIVKKQSEGVTVALRHVDFAELLPQGPRSDVDLDLKARGGGTSLETLVGEVHLSVPRSTMAGHALGPVQLDASARGGEFELSRLNAQLPGVSVEGSGKGTREQLAVELRVDARDLATFSQTVGKLAGSGGLPLAGSGRLTLSAKGPVRHPALSLDARFPTLQYQENRFHELALTATSPDGRAFSLDARAKGKMPLALSLSGTLDEDSKGGRLGAFSLSYPEATWKLDAPVRISMRNERLSVSPMRLRSGNQLIALEADKRGERLKAAVGISHLDLGRLPKVFVNPDWKLAGHLDADVRAGGTTSKPQLQARLGLRGGRFRTYSKLALDLDATYLKERARGSLKANGVGAKLNADFDVPVSALKERRREPVHLKATIAELRLDDSLRELGIDKPLHGFVSADVELSGMANDPRLKVVAQGRQLRFQQLPAADVRLGLQSEEDAKLGLRVDLTTLGKPSRVALKAPFTLAGLIQKPPTEEQLMNAAVRLEADVRELPVPVLYTAGLVDKEVLGVLSVHGQLEGPVMAPVGKLSAVLKGASAGSPTPVDLIVDLDAGKEQLRLTAQALQADHRLLEARATVAAPPARLRSVKSLARVPIQLDADVGPVALAEIQQFTAQPPAPGESAPQLAGKLRAKLQARGTLRDPKLTIRSTVEGLGTQGSPIGNVEMSYEYASAKSLVELALRSAGGQLHVEGSMDADLSYPAVMRPGALKRAPLQADLSAQNFDPSFLSGISEKVKQVGGQLRANAALRGTLGAPALQGDVEWTGGVLALQGNGEFRDIHLQLTGNQERIELKDLSVKSGKGTAKLTALATRDGKRWAIQAQSHLDRFPIITEDQLLATVSLRSTAEGGASSSQVFIRNLRIPEAHVELPDVQRKDLQKLDEPKDIVLVRNGKPIHKQKDEAGSEAGVGGSGAPSGGPTLVLLVDAPRNLWVRGNDVNAEVGLSDKFRVEYGNELLLFGAVQVLRGRVEVFGRRFDVANDSKVRFTGPMLQPDVQVTADHRNEREGVTVHLKVAGQGESLQITPTSDPPLSESEIYTLLATGRRTLRQGTGASSPTGQAASLLGSLAANQLKKTLSNKLPLDVLSIEAGDQGLQGTKLEAGTYVNDRLYIGFTGRIGADPMRGENANAVRLEYQLSKRWSLEAEYGDAKAGGADLMWGKEY